MRSIYLEDGKVVLLDQTLLPGELRYVECDDVDSLARAIEELKVRGAPLLGVASAFGIALAAMKARGRPRREVMAELERAAARLRSTRPTAVNLFHSAQRVLEAARRDEDPAGRAVEEALRIYEEDLRVNRELARRGAELLEDGDVLLTHCNTGSLATAGYGTALGVITEAHRQGKRLLVYACETRPLLQGARLTASELVEEGVPVTVITDGAAGYVMRARGVSKVIVGADRIARNGDTANKIGTYQLAVLAREHGIPFYVAAPTSTFDLAAASGEEIPIEFRDAGEVAFVGGRRVVPARAEVLNPAFDITPARYIEGFITERGLLKPPLG